MAAPRPSRATATTIARVPLLIALLCIQPAFAATSGIPELARRVEARSQQSPRPDDLVFAESMRSEYQSAFGGIDDARHLAGESNEDLLLHWHAIENAAFYSADAGLADSARRVFGELERRGLADAMATGRSFDFLLKARRFGAAREFSARHPDARLPAVPDFIESDTGGLPGAWRLSGDGSTAERIGIDLQPLQVIVVAGCHFSEDAARDIAGDPVLAPAFARHARWLSLPPGSEKLDAIAEWNRAHPQAPMLPIEDRAEWAMIAQWTMPTFAIVKDGKVVDSVKGWRSGEPEFRDQLVALLRRAGLLAADAR